MLKKLLGTSGSDFSNFNNRKSRDLQARRGPSSPPLCSGSSVHIDFHASPSGSSLLSNASPTSPYHNLNNHNYYSQPNIHKSTPTSTTSLFSSISSSSIPPATHSYPSLSVIDEVDTRNLLYGSTGLEPTNLAKINSSRDIRVVIISDIQRLDIPFYDSASNSQELVFPTVSSSVSIPSQQRRASFSSSPVFKSPHHQFHQKYAAEIPTYSNLQSRVFGHSHMKYSGPVTKLHPLPLTEAPNCNGSHNSDTSNSNLSSSHSSTHSNSSNGSVASFAPPKQVWLVSRIFKLSRNDRATTLSTPDTTSSVSASFNTFFQNSLNKHISFSDNRSPLIKQSYNKTQSPQHNYLNFTDPYNTSPSKNTKKYNKTSNPLSGSSSTSTVGPSISDYNVAICVFISSPHDPQSNITDYWEELTAALLGLQTSVSAKLSATLPFLARDFVATTCVDSYSSSDITSSFNYTQRSQCLTFNSSTNQHQYQHNTPCTSRRNFHKYSLNGNQTLKHSIDAFKSRFLTSIRVPRVICGQEKWTELVNVFKWALTSFGPYSDK